MKQLLFISVALLAALLCPMSARGGEDGDCTMDVVGYPADGQADIPLNTVLTYNQLYPIWSEGHDELTVCTDTETGFPTTASGLEVTDCEWITRPSEPLVANTTYFVTVSGCDGLPIATFTTGEDELNEPLELILDEDDPGAGLYIPYESNNQIVLVEVPHYREISLGWDSLAVSPVDGIIDLRERLAGRPNGESVFLRIYDQVGNLWEGTVTVVSPVEPPADPASGSGSDSGCAHVGGSGHAGAAVLAILLLAMTWLSRRDRRRERG